MDNLLNRLYSLLYSLPAILTALVLHEYAHGRVAYAMGDPTAKNAGRLTLNPLKHLDPIGFLCLVILRFGWANPVPVNPYYFKNRRRGMILTAVAGPLANLALAFFSMLALYIIVLYLPYGKAAQVLYNVFYIGILINIGLAIFNLIPIPPLDGSKILLPLLPQKAQYYAVKNEKYIKIFLALLMISGRLTVPLGIARDWVFRGMKAVVEWIML